MLYQESLGSHDPVNFSPYWPPRFLTEAVRGEMNIRTIKARGVGTNEAEFTGRAPA